MADILLWCYAHLQAFGKLVYELFGNNQVAVVAGTVCAAVILAVIVAFRRRKAALPTVWFLLSACFAFLGQIALRNGYFLTGIALYLVSAALMICYCSLVKGDYGLQEIKIGRDATIVLVGIVLACAAYLRFYDLSGYPGGLNNDEALFSYYGLLTMRGEPLRGWWAANSRYMFVYLYSLASVFKVFGASIVIARATSAFIGMLGVLALFLMADKLFKRGVALLAALSLSFCFCSFGFDRIAHCMNWGTLFACFSLYLLLSSETPGRKYFGFSSGVVMGLGLFTYDVYKGALLAILLFLIYRVLFQRGYLRKNWLALILLVAGFMVVAGPMMKDMRAYSVGYMKSIFAFIGRPRLPQNGSHSGLLLANVKFFMRMLFLNMSESIHLVRKGPILNDALVPLFFMGFVCSLYNWKRYNYFLILVWFLLSPIGGILSWACLRRIIIFMPALHLLVALGAFLLIRNVEYAIGLRRGRAFVSALLVMVAILLPVNAYIYFNRARIFSEAHLRAWGECVESQIGKRFVCLVDIESSGGGPAIYFITYDSRKGEDPSRYYKYVTGETMYNCIFNSPPNDLIFVSTAKPAIMERVTLLEKVVPLAEVAKKPHVNACMVYEKGLAQWRGVDVSYRKMGEDGLATEWAKERTETTEFDWRNNPLPYPLEVLAEGYFYVPQDGRYEFHVAGDGETELYVDGDEIDVAPSRERHLEKGAHEIFIVSVQREPGALSITWGAPGKPPSPIYLWSGLVERLCGIKR